MRNKLEFEAFVKYDNETAYSACMDFNALCKVNLDTGKCLFLRIFEKEALFGKRLYVYGVYANEHIYFAPASANSLAIYDIKGDSLSYVEIYEPTKEQYPFYNKKFKFNGAIVHKNYIYLLPCTYPAVVRFDLENGNVDYFNEWLPDTSYTFRKSWCEINNKIYMTSDSNNIVLEFDLDSCKGKFYHIGNNNRGCWGICNLGENIWLSPKKAGPVIKWNPATGHVTEYGSYPNDFVGKDFCFTGIYVKDNMVHLIPAKANMAICLNPNKTNMQIEKKTLEILMDNDGVRYLFKINNWAYLKIRNGNKIKYIMFNLETDDYYELSYVLENCNIYFKTVCKFAKEQKEIMHENVNMELEDFIGGLCSELL